MANGSGKGPEVSPFVLKIPNFELLLKLKFSLNYLISSFHGLIKMVDKMAENQQNFCLALLGVKFRGHTCNVKLCRKF